MMGTFEIPGDWTEPERWVWECIAAGEPANLNTRPPHPKALDPRTEQGWGDNRRLRVKFLQLILTRKAFIEAIPFGGVRIVGALIDDAPLDFENFRLPYQFCLEESRILTDVKWRYLRVDGGLSLERCFVASVADLSEANIQESVRLSDATVEGGLYLFGAKIGHLYAASSIFEGDVTLNSATVDGSAFLQGATFRGGLDLTWTNIRLILNMIDSVSERDVTLNSVTVDGAAFLCSATFKGGLNLDGAKIGALEMHDSTFEGEVRVNGAKIAKQLLLKGSIFKEDVRLNSSTIEDAAFLNGATFKGRLNLVAARIGSLHTDGSAFDNEVDLESAKIGYLDMRASTFDGDVSLSGAMVDAVALLGNGATFKGKLNLTFTEIGTLDMGGSTFDGDVILSGATVNDVAFLGDSAFKGKLNLRFSKIGSQLATPGSTFERDVILADASVRGGAFLGDGASFKSELNLLAAKIGTLDMAGSTFEGAVNLTACTITGRFVLGSSAAESAGWGDAASLSLCNTHVGSFRDWWKNESTNAWPKTYQLEGFTYDRLGAIDAEEETDMLDRPITSFIQWLNRDRGTSSQPHENLAQFFHEAGEPYKSARVLYAARERRRRKAWTTVGDDGQGKKREWLEALGLFALRITIGYGLGSRYFRVLWWVAGFSVLGALVLILFGSHPSAQWPHLFFTSLDQLLPIVTLDKAHDVLIFGDPSVNPPLAAQPYGVRIYFYAHKIAGWVLGSFLVAGLAGLTQRN